MLCVPPPALAVASYDDELPKSIKAALSLSPIPRSIESQRKCDQAALMVQRCWKSKANRSRGRALLSLWPNLASLKQLYLDDEAVAAGAKTSSLYTDEAIIQRELLTHHPLVQEALARLWASVPRTGDDLTKDEYMTIARKIYLIICVEQRQIDQIDPNSWREDAERDFVSDSKGKSSLSEEDAHRAWFQLCDLYTSDISAAGYAAWIRRKAELMTTSYSGAAAQALATLGERVREWRDDSEMMALAALGDGQGAAAGRTHLDDGEWVHNISTGLASQRGAWGSPRSGSAQSDRHRAFEGVAASVERRLSLPDFNAARRQQTANGKARRHSKDSLLGGGSALSLRRTASSQLGASVSKRSSAAVAARLRWASALASDQKLERQRCEQHAQQVLERAQAAESHRTSVTRRERLSKENVPAGGVKSRAKGALRTALFERDPNDLYGGVPRPPIPKQPMMDTLGGVGRSFKPPNPAQAPKKGLDAPMPAAGLHMRKRPALTPLSPLQRKAMAHASQSKVAEPLVRVRSGGWTEYPLAHPTESIHRQLPTESGTSSSSASNASSNASSRRGTPPRLKGRLGAMGLPLNRHTQLAPLTEEQLLARLGQRARLSVNRSTGYVWCPDV